MNGCPEFEALSAHADGEGDAVTASHVEHCEACTETLRRIAGLGDALRARRAEEAAPSLERVLEELAPRPRRAHRWMTGIASVAAAAAVGVLSISTGSVPAAVAEEAVSQHLRAFANGRACETESTDPDRLERFFTESLGREIDVPTPTRGRLVGARRCSLFGERAAAVVYADGDVQVTMFVPPPGSRAAERSASALGRCTPSRDGQTVCVVAGEDGEPRVVVGGLPADELGTLLVQR